MKEHTERNITANPLIVLREEFDNWAILFDPDTGNTFGLNPIGVLIWKHLDGHHTLDDITKKVSDSAENVPPDVTDQVKDFIRHATRLGLAGHNAS